LLLRFALEYNELKDRPKVLKQSASLTADQQKAEQAVTSLKNLAKTLEDAGLLFDVADFRSKWDTEVRKVKEHCAALLGHVDGFSRLHNDASSAMKVAKGKWTDDRDVIVSKFRNKAVLGSLAKLFGDAVMAQREDPKKVGLDFPYNVNQMLLEVSDIGPMEYWSVCRLVPAPTENNKNAYSVRIKTFVDAHMAHIMKIQEANLASMRQTGGPGGVGDLQGYCLEFCERGKPWDLAAMPSTPVYTYEHYSCNPAASAWPFKGFRGIIHVISGTLLVVSVPPPSLVTHPDLTTWMKGADGVELAKHTETFIVQESSSLYIAF